jgi:hypothetical protein
VPTQVPTAQRVRLSCCGIPLIRCCCHFHYPGWLRCFRHGVHRCKCVKVRQQSKCTWNGLPDSTVIAPGF